MLTLLIINIIALYISITTQKQFLLDQAKKDLNTNTEILNNSIKSVMLSGEAPLAILTMKRMKNISSLKEVEIYRQDGEVAFIDYDTLDFVNKYQDVFNFEKTARVSQKMTDNKYFQLAISEEKEQFNELVKEREIEYYFPISNDGECQMCHGTPEESGRIRGIAHFKISTFSIYNDIKKATIILIILFISAGITLAFLLILFLQRIIVNPIFKIGHTVNKFGEGNLDLKVKLKNKDELGDLANKINDMFKRIIERFELSKFVSRSTDEMIKKGNLVDGEGNKKIITVLFADIRGFTNFSEAHPPVEVIQNLNRILQVEANIVEHHGGDIDKFVGDELMAIFDNEYNALKCAFEMIVEVKKVNKKFNTPLFIGIGINTGEVIAGNIGSKNRLEYAVIGDTINLASRLCNIAKANMLLISESTYTKVKNRVKAKLIADQKIKGKSGSVNFYVVQSVK
jgi:adenylate cyclase